MRYLITGASGLLGGRLMEYLLLGKKNHITVLKHNADIPNNKLVKTVPGNILDTDSLIAASKNIDIIVHCAALINGNSQTDYLKVNFLGTKNLLRAARLNKVTKFVYISSWSASKTSGNYGLSKYLAENEVKRFSNYIIVRPVDIYSLSKSHLLNYIQVVKKLPFIPIFGKGLYMVSPLFVDDLVTAIVYIIKNYTNKTFTITGPEIFTFVEFNKLLLSKLKIKRPFLYVPYYPASIIVRLFDSLGIPFFMNCEQFVRLTSEKRLPGSLEKTLTRGFLRFESVLDKFNTANEKD